MSQSPFTNPADTNSVFPNLHLLVSGGNSQLILSQSWTDWQIIGQTLDDAAGECFDKIGRMIGFDYPAGVYVAKTAKTRIGNPLNLPVGMQKSGDLNYSFSGLKTAVRYLIQEQKIANLEFEKPLDDLEKKALLEASSSSDLSNPKLKFIYDICLSTQTVVVEQLINKLEKAIKLHSPVTLGLSGGVSANLLLRQRAEEVCHGFGLKKLFIPDLRLTGDNAVMIGLAGIANNYVDENNSLKNPY